MSVESERNNTTRKRNELIKLQQEYAKEQAKIAPLQKKVLDAQAAIQRTKIQSTKKQRLTRLSEQISVSWKQRKRLVKYRKK